MLQEHEMREFFQRVVDQVATLSTQASRVEGLEQRINELADRLRNVEEENNRLRNDLRAAETLMAETQDKLAATRRDYENEIAVTQGLRETIVSRDSRVHELTDNLQVERDAHSTTLRERDEARNEVGDLRALVQSLRDQLAHTNNDRDGWKDRAYKAEAHVQEIEAKLKQIMGVLQPVNVPSQDVAASV